MTEQQTKSEDYQQGYVAGLALAGRILGTLSRSNTAEVAYVIALIVKDLKGERNKENCPHLHESLKRDHHNQLRCTDCDALMFPGSYV